jgi:Tfp pilus assembly protein PilO
MSDTSAKNSARELVLTQLRNPLKLRLFICLTIISLWYFSFFTPLVDKTEKTTTRISLERKRIATAREIETLKKALAPHHGFILAGANLSELMRHVMDRLRSSPLKLIDLKPETPKNLGPYDAIGVQLALEGEFGELNAFLSWVESDGRYLRVDSIKIDPNQRDPGRLKAQVKLLSLAESASATTNAKPEPGKSQPSKKVE